MWPSRIRNCTAFGTLRSEVQIVYLYFSKNAKIIYISCPESKQYAKLCNTGAVYFTYTEN